MRRVVVHQLPVLIAGAGAILITLLFWAVLPASQRGTIHSDFQLYYEPVARNLLGGSGMIDTQGNPAVRYPPAFPALLAAIFGLAQLVQLPDPIAINLFILLCTGTSGALLYTIARLLWAPLPAALTTLAWACYPPVLWVSKQANSETPFMVFFYAAVLAFWYAVLRRPRAWPLFLVAGLLAGLAALTRPIGIVIAPVMALTLLLMWRVAAGRRWAMVALLLAGFLTPIMPWQIWIYTQTGRTVLLSTGGPSSMRDGLTFAVNKREKRQGVSLPDDVIATMSRIRDHGGEIRSYGDVVRMLGEEFQRDPAAVLKLLGIKAARSWYATDSERFEVPALLMQISVFLALLASCGLLLHAGGDKRFYAVLIALMLLATWGMTFLVLSILRYMTPVIGLALTTLPALLPARAYAWASGLRVRLRQHRSEPR
ncbi:hypothetical protein EKD04_001915 [Chloroflexales bacterium ZM16-3]|nr:hypothetical protein [Chloroflexales bacterium ZM16-3]